MAVSAETVFEKSMTAAERAQAKALAVKLLAEHRTLQDLRKARRQTQAALAEKLGKKQATIAQMEKRGDMLLSTLRGYVEAMGGSLNLVVEFPDREPVVLAGFGDAEDAA